MRTPNMFVAEFVVAVFGAAVLGLSTPALAQPTAPEPEPEPTPTAKADPEPEPKPAVVTGKSWKIGIAPRMGFTIPTSKLGAMAVGGLEIGYALSRFVITLDVSLTKPTHGGGATDPRVGGDGDYDIDESELKLGLGGVFRLFTGERRLIPWGGLSVVMQLLKSTETTSFAPGENTSQDTRFGVELVGGVDYLLGPGYLVGEMRIVYTGLDHLLTGDSNAGNVMTSIGYRIVF